MAARCILPPPHNIGPASLPFVVAGKPSGYQNLSLDHQMPVGRIIFRSQTYTERRGRFISYLWSCIHTYSLTCSVPGIFRAITVACVCVPVVLSV